MAHMPAKATLPSGSASYSTIELQPIAPAALCNQGRVLGEKIMIDVDPVEFFRNHQ
jgi:hypothetical protein